MAAAQRPSLGRPRALAALLAAYARVTTATGTLGPDELLRPSPCAGWTAGDVLYHQLLDARRALIAFASPAADTETPDVDDISYWRPYSPRGRADPAGPPRR